MTRGPAFMRQLDVTSMLSGLGIEKGEVHNVTTRVFEGCRLGLRTSCCVFRAVLIRMLSSTADERPW